MSLYNAPVAKRTRRQMEIQWQQLLGKGPRNKTRKPNVETEFSESDLGHEVDELIKKTPIKTTAQNEFAGPSSPYSKVNKKLSDESSFTESEDEESYSEGSRNNIRKPKKETGFFRSDQGPEVVKNAASKTTRTQNGSATPSSAYKLIDESSLDESGEEESDTEESSDFSPEESDGVEKTDSSELEDVEMKRNNYGSADHIKNGRHKDSVYSSDDSDSDDDVIVLDKQKGADEDFEISHKYHGGCQNNMKVGSIQSTDDDEDGVFSTSESEGDRLDESNFPVPERKQSPAKNAMEKVHSVHTTKMKKMDEKSTDESSDGSDFPLVKRKQSHVENRKEKVWSTSVNRDTNKHSVKKGMKKMDEKPMDESSATDNLNDSNFPQVKVWSASVDKEEKKHQVNYTRMIKMDLKPMDESSATDHLNDSNFPQVNMKQYPIKNTKEKVRSASVDKEEKKHQVNDARMNKMDLKPMDESSATDHLNDSNFSQVNMKQYPIKNTNEKVWSASVDKEGKKHQVNDTRMNKMDLKPTDESSATDNLDDSNIAKVNMKQSPIKNTKEKVWSACIDKEGKKHPVSNTRMKKIDAKPMDESSDTDVYEKTKEKEKVNDCYVDKENAVKYQESTKGEQKDDGGSAGAVLDTIINNGAKADDSIPLRFKFEDSDDESLIQKNDESNGTELFEEMDFVLKCEEIGSYKTPTVEKQQTDDCVDSVELCRRGEHGDTYFEEQIGMRCRLCGAVLLESRYVIPKLANYSLDESRRSCRDERQVSIPGNTSFEDSDWNPVGICTQTKGTVWQLVPNNIRGHLYPHQLEAFQFLWENLAGTIELSELQKLGPRGGTGGGGCIISHAPGTGKTLLTIVFTESFLKKFPRCCPVIVAPASMLLTWEAEFKKWQVGVSFVNLNNSDLLIKELSNKSGSRVNKNWIRIMKIHSWSNGGSVLGISYSLYEKLAGSTDKNNTNHKKMGTVLLDVSNLVVLDEGHTPRNQTSSIWNILLRLKTKNRLILSGTPFQNNFRELFNTLRLVRPETATKIVNEKAFADMIQSRNQKKCGDGSSASEDIEKLKVIISPFVHVHNGRILEKKLPGLKQSVILLNPRPLQKGFIENLGLGNPLKNFEYDYKVALVSIHPSLILRCTLSQKEEESTNSEHLKNVRLHPDVGVKTRFVTELIRLSAALHEKVLIFSQYIPPLELLKDQIAHVFGWDVKREIMLIKGRIKQSLRKTIINDFNDPQSKVKVLLASTKCCSEGIHLTGASRVVLLDVVWNPSVERQAISRAYRLGQKKVVYTYHLMAAGTTEEEKYNRQVEKGRLAEMVFSSSAMADKEQKNKEKAVVIELNDKILQQMVQHQELKEMFNKITYPENQTTS